MSVVGALGHLVRECDLPVGEGAVGITVLRTLEYRRMIMEGFDELSDAAKDKNWGEYLLKEVGGCDLFDLQLTQEAGLETVLVSCVLLEITQLI